MANIYSVNLLDILPESIKNDPQVQAMAEAVSQEIQSVSSDIALCILLARLDELPEEIVDLLAWQTHVDFYESDLPIEQKKDLVRQAIPWHRYKGTKWAVEQVVSIIFKEVKIKEWFEYGGDPYHFRLETEQTLTNDTDLDRLVRMINATKNTRSWLEDVTIKRNINSDRSYGGFLSEYRKAEICPIKFVMPNLESSRYRAGFFSFWNILSVYPVPFVMPNISGGKYFSGAISYWKKTIINPEV